MFFVNCQNCYRTLLNSLEKIFKDPWSSKMVKKTVEKFPFTDVVFNLVTAAHHNRLVQMGGMEKIESKRARFECCSSKSNQTQ